MTMRTQAGAQANRALRISLISVLSLFFISFFFAPAGDSTVVEEARRRWGAHKSIEERVEHILKHTPLIDGHNDLPIFIRAVFNNHIYESNFTGPFQDGSFPSHTDLARLRKGGVGGAFWSVFWPCPGNGSDFSDDNYAPTVQATLNQIDVMTRVKNAYPDQFSSSLTSRSALASFYHHHSLISPLGIEGLHQIGNSAATLRLYHALGVRYATLTHNCPNIYADSALAEHPFRIAPPIHHGVSPKGRRLIREMNRVGMIVDLSHTSVETQLDVLGAGKDDWEGSVAPVIFSHSSVWNICPHPRNVKDEVLGRVKERRGVVMINFSPDFISCKSKGEGELPEFDKENATLDQVVRHVLYIGEKIGWDFVGLGSDFDGIESTPRGLEDVSKYPDLIAELLRKGVKDDDAKKLVGGNVLRVWREAERVAEELQRKGEPVLEDDLHSAW